MTEIERLTRLLRLTFEGQPLYSVALLTILAGTSSERAAQAPSGDAPSIWSIVTRLTAELIQARQVIEGNALPEEGKTWLEVATTSELAWWQAQRDLKRAYRQLLRAASQLEQEVPRRQKTSLTALERVVQLSLFYAGQVDLLVGMGDGESLPPFLGHIK
jgi:hypothetical protein